MEQREQHSEREQHADESLSQKQRETEALLAATRAIPTRETFAEAARGIYDAAKDLLGADSGYVALLSDDGENNDLLFLDSGGRGCMVDPTLPMPIRGLRQMACREGHPVWENNFENSRWRELLPEGHVALESVLFAPIMIDGVAVGVLGLANKPGGFDEHDAKLSESFADISGVGLRFSRERTRLRASEARFRDFFENQPDYCTMLAPDGKIVDVNRATLGRLGYAKEELVGSHIETIYAPESRDKIPALMAKWKAEGALCDEEMTLLCKNGERRHVLLSAGNIRGHGGDIVSAVSVQRDVTDRVKAEEQLRTSERRYKEAERITHLGSWELDIATGKWIWSDELFRICGYAPGSVEPSGAVASGLIHPDDRLAVETAVQRSIATEVPYCIEHRVLRPDGEQRWVQSMGRVVRNAQSSAQTLLGSTLDITDRKLVERALMTEKEFTDTALSAQLDTFFLFELATKKAVKWNRAFRELSGYSDEEVARLPAPDSYYGPEDLERAAAFIENVLRDGTGAIELELVCKDGRKIPTEYQVSVIPDDLSQPRYIVSIGRDVTERKRSEQAMLLQQRAITLNNRIANVFLTASRGEDFDDLVEVLEVTCSALDSPIGYFGYIDETGALVCPSMSREVWDRCQVPGKSNTFQRAVWGGIWGRSLLEKRTVVANLGLRVPVGHLSLECAMAVPLVLHDRLIGQVVVANKPGGYDVYDQQILESVAAQTAPVLNARLEELRQRREREQLEEQYRQAQKMEAVGRLAGGVAHDFNNLLTLINSYAAFALASLSDEDPMRADIGQILDAGERASGLTHQLLAFSRKQVLEPRILNLNEVIAGAERILRRLIGEDIDFRTELAEDLGPVSADPGQIEQVMMNLALNARDAMPMGGQLTIVTANVTRCGDIEEGPRQGACVMLAVSDSGVGMSAEVKERIFEPFFTTKELGRGTGLGLSTVYGIVKQSNGYILVDSEPDRGTTFKVYLPCISGEPVERPSVRNNADLRGHGERILVVEDEPMVRRLVQRILGSAGYGVVVAANGDEALRVCQHHEGRLDLVLTDVVMPSMGGKELADRLHGTHPGFKVLFMSGYTDEAIARHGVLDPGVQLIAKPFSPVDLLRKVREVLGS